MKQRIMPVISIGKIGSRLMIKPRIEVQKVLVWNTIMTNESGTINRATLKRKKSHYPPMILVSMATLWLLGNSLIGLVRFGISMIIENTRRAMLRNSPWSMIETPCYPMNLKTAARPTIPTHTRFIAIIAFTRLSFTSGFLSKRRSPSSYCLFSSFDDCILNT